MAFFGLTSLGPQSVFSHNLRADSASAQSSSDSRPPSRPSSQQLQQQQEARPASASVGTRSAKFSRSQPQTRDLRPQTAGAGGTSGAYLSLQSRGINRLSMTQRELPSASTLGLTQRELKTRTESLVTSRGLAAESTGTQAAADKPQWNALHPFHRSLAIRE